MEAYSYSIFLSLLDDFSYVMNSDSLASKSLDWGKTCGGWVKKKDKRWLRVRADEMGEDLNAKLLDPKMQAGISN